MREEISDPPLGPSYLSAPVATTPVEREAVARGMLAATTAVLGGIVLTVVSWRLGLHYPVGAAVMSAGAVLLYARSARRAPRRGLVPLLMLLAIGTLLAFYALFVNDGWEVYSALSREMPMPMTRGEFIRTAAATPWMIEGYRDVLLQVIGCVVAGAVGAAALLWRLERSAR